MSHYGELLSYVIAYTYLWRKYRRASGGLVTTLLGLNPLEHIALAYLIWWPLHSLFGV